MLHKSVERVRFRFRLHAQMLYCSLSLSLTVSRDDDESFNTLGCRRPEERMEWEDEMQATSPLQ